MTPQELQQQFMSAIVAFNSRRVDILQKGFTDGGAARVEELENEYDTLRDGYFDLLRANLDQNNHRYGELTDSAVAATKAIARSVDHLDNTKQLLDNVSAAINVLGRILVVLGI